MFTLCIHDLSLYAPCSPAIHDSRTTLWHCMNLCSSSHQIRSQDGVVGKVTATGYTRVCDRGLGWSGYHASVFANASSSALSAVGGDSRVVSRYAVRRRSVASSSNDASTLVDGAAVWDGDVVAARGSVLSLYVHCGRGISRRIVRRMMQHAPISRRTML